MCLHFSLFDFSICGMFVCQIFIMKSRAQFCWKFEFKITSPWPTVFLALQFFLFYCIWFSSVLKFYMFTFCCFCILVPFFKKIQRFLFLMSCFTTLMKNSYFLFLLFICFVYLLGWSVLPVISEITFISGHIICVMLYLLELS